MATFVLNKHLKYHKEIIRINIRYIPSKVNLVITAIFFSYIYDTMGS